MLMQIIYRFGNNNSSTPSGITLGSTANSSIRFSDAGNANDGYMLYNHADTSLRFGANNAERVRIDSNGFCSWENFSYFYKSWC